MTFEKLISSTIIISLFICVAETTDWQFLDPVKLQTKTPPLVQQYTAWNIIAKYTNKVIVTVDPGMFIDHKDVFELKTVDNKLVITASSGVAVLWGFNYYLKKYCKSHIGWQVNRVEIPAVLPEVNKRVVASDRFRYYQNVCTFGYSFVWWNVQQWKDHVEWMAMNGINLALAPIDQEAAWARIYSAVGMTDEDIEKHFTGPAFLPWLRMGNVHGWGGPLLPSWHNRQKLIEKAIISLMYDLGMVPVLPGFNGHVPRKFKELFPSCQFHEVASWCGFNNTYCCGLFVDPSDALFTEIGERFLSEITEVGGNSHIYTADPFNEVQVSSFTIDDIKTTSKSIFSSMLKVDPDAVWLVQNWMFVNNPGQWGSERVQALLLAIPKGRILVLDLQSELRPLYDTYSYYYGQPFIWCMLHNFGGTLGMIGKMQTINEKVFEARNDNGTTMIGIGLTPEGINHNYIVYDLMLEAGWKKRPERSLSRWVNSYAERRYGCKSVGKAWKFLSKEIYNYLASNEYLHFYPVFTASPTLSTTTRQVWYRSAGLLKAFEIFVFAPSRCNSKGFYHDLVDITRQVLQYRSEQIYYYLLRDYVYILTNATMYKDYVLTYLDALYDMEKILASNDDFTITNWLEGARSISEDPEEIALYELNARNQITLWGPEGEISDYANKQWAEMLHYYYIPRWTTFLNAAIDAKMNNKTFDQGEIQKQITENIEKPFVSVDIQKLPKWDLRDLALSLYYKWFKEPNLPDLPLLMEYYIRNN